jgi:hypothetical protein
MGREARGRFRETVLRLLELAAARCRREAVPWYPEDRLREQEDVQWRQAVRYPEPAAVKRRQEDRPGEAVKDLGEDKLREQDSVQGSAGTRL